jgi:hypothetical protein
MQPQQLERLKRMINASSMLTGKEKEEWLDLLIVMNDKQVSELEAILNTPSSQPAASAPNPATALPARPIPPAPPAPAPTSAPVPPKNDMPTPRPPVAPPLTHISNLPSGIAQMPSAPRPNRPASSLNYPPPRPQAVRTDSLKQWENKLKRSLEEKELPKPPEEKSLSAAPQAAPKPVPPVSRPMPPPRQPAIERPVPAESALPVQITEPKDVSQLTVGNMKSMSGSLAETLKQMVARSNYFEVLFYLEKSPLYQAYLETGREALSDSSSAFPSGKEGKNFLTKGEFEAFSDLLKSIQIS